MPESLQQKVDRMTAGMEVTVTFGGVYPGTLTGPTTGNPLAGPSLRIAGRSVRFHDGGFPADITAIDMPDPECPFETGARVLGDGSKNVWTVTGWEFNDSFGAWMVWLDDGGISGLSDPEDLTLAPPEPAEHDHKGFSEEKCVRCGWIMGRAPLNCMNDDTPHVFPSQQQRASDRCERVEPADPDCPAVLVTYTDGVVMVKYNDMSLDWWLGRPDVATVQALRPAEYLRGGR